MQKSQNVLPIHVPRWLMSEFHWKAYHWKPDKPVGRRPSQRRRGIKRRLNRNGRRNAKLLLKKERYYVKRAIVRSGEHEL